MESLGDIPISGDGLRFEEFEGPGHLRAVSEKVELRMALRLYIAAIRGRADRAGPQAYAYTYRQVADELERLLDGND